MNKYKKCTVCGYTIKEDEKLPVFKATGVETCPQCGVRLDIDFNAAWDRGLSSALALVGD